MHLRTVLLGAIICTTLALVACDGPGAPALPTPAGLAAGETPGARATPGGPAGGRGANATPGGQRPGGQAQRTPQATPASGAAAPTAVSAAVQTPTSGAVPTAVPIPVVPIPTVRPSGSAEATPGGSIAYTPIPLPSIPPLPTAPPAITREQLRGKILFFSDRSGYPQLHVMDPDGGNQRLCNCSYLLESLVSDELVSPDKNNVLFFRTLGGSSRGGGDQQIWARNLATGVEAPVTGDAPGFPGVDYDPAWSPDARYIAWVTQVNGFDEIYLHDAVENSNVRLTESHGEWYKRPTFSPNGSQIAFWTNKEIAERKQIWVMNLDGSGAHNVSRSQYNDYDPLWVK